MENGPPRVSIEMSDSEHFTVTPFVYDEEVKRNMCTIVVRHFLR